MASENKVWWLHGMVNERFDECHPNVVCTDRFFILVDTTYNDACELASSWGLEPPDEAPSGVYVAESGNEVYVADGKLEEGVEVVASFLGWKGVDAFGDALSAEEYMWDSNLVF